MDISHQSHSEADPKRAIDRVQHARELNRQAMRRHQDEIDRMMAATLSPWLAVTIGCIVGATLFAAGMITAKLL